MENEQKIDGLTEGRMVHYVLDGDTKNPGDHRPAVIVRVWDHSEPGTSNLLVFVDGSNDIVETNKDGQRVTTVIDWKTSINHSEEKEPGTWHWIEKA